MKFLSILIISILVCTSFVIAEEDAKKKQAKETAEHKHSENEAKEDHHDEEKHDEAEHKNEGEEAHDEADHKHEGEETSEEAGHKHEGEDEHGHGEEENSQVGPDKGILEASEKQGIKLSPEAEKNFDIEKIQITNINSISIEKSTLVTSGVETNIYRYRDGFYKRIDFKINSRNGSKLNITSSDLLKGDSIVTKGLGFILIAEIAAFGGAPEGHSH